MVVTGVDWTTTSSEQEKMRCELHALQIHAHVTKEVDPLLKRCVCKYQVSTYHYQQCLNGPCVIVLMHVVWLVHMEFNKL